MENLHFQKPPNRKEGAFITPSVIFILKKKDGGFDLSFQNRRQAGNTAITTARNLQNKRSR